MGRSLYPPTPDNIIEDYDKNNEYYHKASDMYFRMTREGDKFFQTSFQKDPSGNPIHQQKVQISYVVGSGNHSRSYVHREPDGKLYQLPIAWYTQENAWAMNPGYDSDQHINFSRRITYDCMFCHAAYPELKPGADQNNFGESSFFPEHLQAIDCERCHGPAQEHVNLARSGAAKDAILKAIVNTGNMSDQLQLEVCMQCHLETTSGNLPHSVHVVDKGIFGYRPGEPLEDYRYAFNHPKGTGHDDKFEIAGQAYRMRMSPCYIKSQGKMTCTTCHDPHRVPTDRIAAGIQSCLECHKPADCTERMELRMPVKDNCIQCHMPKRRTDDVIHVVMTDHFIQRRPPSEAELLAPRKEQSPPYRGDVVAYYPEEISANKRDLYMGLAYIANSANLEKGISFLDAALKKSPREFAAVYTRGVALKLLEQLDAARDGLEQAVKLRPDHPQAWMALGDLYEKLQNYQRSMECYRTAAKCDPRLSRAQNGIGTSALLAGDQTTAEKAFRAAVLLDPFDDNPHLNLAGVFLQQGKYDAAAAEARAALAISPLHAGGWATLAQCALATDKPVDAIWPALEAIRADGSDPQLGSLLVAACKQVEPSLAMSKLQGLESKSNFTALVAQARVKLFAGDAAAAAQLLDAAATGGTTSTAMAVPAAQAALEANRPALALLWSSDVADDVANDEIVVAYASALRANNQEAAAEEYLQRASKGPAGQSPRVLNALAWLRATAKADNLRNGSEAVSLVSRAVESMGGKPNVFLLQTQAAAAAESGDVDGAQSLAQSALDMATQAHLNAEIPRIQAQLQDYKAGRAHRAPW